MKSLKKWFAMATTVVMFGTTALYGANDCSYAGGACYQECRTAPKLAPAIALGAIALVAIIAVAVQDNDHGHAQ